MIRTAAGLLVPGKITWADCLLLLPELDDGQFDVIFFDWPFATSSPVRGKEDGAAGRLWGPISFLTRAAQQAHRVAKLGCHLYCFTNHQGSPDHGLALSMGGWFPTTTIAWNGHYIGTGGIYRNAWSPIFFSSKGPAEVRVPGKAFANWVDEPAIRRDKDHPYEKPPGLWRKLCAPSVIPGTRVLDVFAGSGSSRAVVEALGAEWFGIDVDPNYAEAA